MTHAVTPAPTAGVDWASCILTRANLANADLQDADLQNADLDAADLDGANLVGADLQAFMDQASLVGADAADASFATDDLVEAHLDNANLSGADLDRTDLSDATLTGTKLISANLDAAFIETAAIGGADLTGATLSAVHATGLTGTPTLPANWQVTGGFLIGPGADIGHDNLSGLDLSGADLQDAHIIFSNLTGTNFTNANFDGADLVDTDLDGATVTGATFASVFWLGVTCPDGSKADKYVAGCFSTLDLTPPNAHPVITSGQSSANGWFLTPVTIAWNWTDNGTIDGCIRSSTSTTSGKAVALTATCFDLAGNEGTATKVLQIDTTKPAVSVTGVIPGHRYIFGAGPTAGCHSTEAVSGIVTPARLTVTKTGSHGAGQFTATCVGAVSNSGSAQQAPVTARYSIGYGFGGFSAPAPGSTVGQPGGSLQVSFRLVTAAGAAIPAATARWLAAHKLVSVRLSGPSITGRSFACTAGHQQATFLCAVKIPATAEPGSGHRYSIAALVKVGGPASLAPEIGKAGKAGRAANPEVIHIG